MKASIFRGGKKLNKYNQEHYVDETANRAIENASRQPGKINAYINFVKELADKQGLEIANRIHVRDKKTGKIYK